MAAQRNLNKKYHPTERTGYWRCGSCGCTDRHACEGGCSWVGKKLCSACDFTPAQVCALLAVGCSGGDFVPSPDALSSWTAIELGQAGRWAEAWLAWCQTTSQPLAWRPPLAPAKPAWLTKRLGHLEKHVRPYSFR